MTYGTLDINNYKIPYSLIDNNAKDTLLCVHGFNSSKKFIGKINTEKLNFNLVSISLPGSKEVETKELSIDLLSRIIRLVVDKIKNTKVHLLGHSLGGALVAMQENNPRIKTYNFVSTYHPLVSQTKVASLFQDFLNPDNGIKKAKKVAIKGALWALNKINYLKNETFLEETLWLDLARKELFNAKFLKQLDHNFKALSNRSNYIVGKNDKVISTESLIEYTSKSLNKKIKIIDGDHNPFKSNLKEMVVWLNDLFIYKKRYFAKLRRVIK